MSAGTSLAVPCTTAAEAAALDARTIAALGGDSFALMRTAAARAAAWLLAAGAPLAGDPTGPIAVWCGPGNNGGDGWLVAAALRRAGRIVRVGAPLEPRTDDARRARAEAGADAPFDAPAGDEPLVIDALLGTGARGAVRAPLDAALAAIAARHAAGARIVALDLPSGLEATTGTVHGAVPAHVTLTFGGVKRGQLLRRDLVGTLVALDIGLPDAPAGVPRVVTAAWARTRLAPLPADAYKATRGRLRIVGGGPGMAGAVILAARGAHAAGVGMVRCAVAEPGLVALQVAVPFATVEPWRPDARWPLGDARWPHATVIGPGLDGGASPDAAQAAHVREEVERLLAASSGPVLLDGGALTAFAGRADALGTALAGRPALLTPHAGEFARLTARRDAPAAIDRFVDPAHLAVVTGATVLLKGVPNVVAAPDGTVRVVPYGNPVLAMGGSGDLLAGACGALLAQGLDPLDAACVGAWAHGAAAEGLAARGGWRGVTMDDVVAALGATWYADADHVLADHVLASFAAVRTA